MEMTAKERTVSAVEHRLPDRVPGFLMAMDEWGDYLKSVAAANGNDVLLRWGAAVDRGPVGFWVFPGWRGPAPKDANGNAMQVWGTSIWEFAYNDYWPRPLAHAQTVADVEAYAWPDAQHFDFEPCRKVREAHSEFLHVASCWQPVFCLLCDLFGMQRTLEHMYLNPALIEAALAHIDEYYSTYYRNEIAACAHCLDFLGLGDDFADQRGLLFPPALWRKWFKPLYAKYMAMGKAAGLRTWMHACGAIREVLPDLVDSGLDVWETVQAHLPGNEPERLKRDFGAHLVFAGGINTQHVLSFGTPDEVRWHVRERIRVLGKGGGYLCGPDHAVKRGVPFENITALFDAVCEFRGEGCTW